MSSVKSFHETFYGTPTVDESRRRRGKKRHTAAKGEPQNEVVVIGVHYRSFDDDSMAAFVNSATALVPWNGDSKLLIDRYDVRHLLQDLTGIRRRRTRPPSPDATKEELDYERYRDVEGLENPSLPEAPDSSSKASKGAVFFQSTKAFLDESTEGRVVWVELREGLNVLWKDSRDELKIEDTGGGYQRVGFDYSIDGDQATRKERAEDALFCPPFFVPEHLRLKIPTSTKAHQIMAGTAKYVIEHGGQAEIVLRVKQANNPTFGFLMPDHYDHEYFRFLVAHPEHVGIGPTLQQEAVAEVAVATSSEEAEGGLSLLGTAYGDADEDDEDEEDDKGGEPRKDRPEEPQEVAAEFLEKVDDVTKQHIDRNSDVDTTSKRSSTINLTISDGAENAIKDTGDSLDVFHGSEFPKAAGEASEVPLDGIVDSSSGSQEPVPPGMEASSSGSGEKEGQESYPLSGDRDHQVPPHKEPPIRLRLIIDKMVEFISRNGKEFEAIVKERDKVDHRFPFFLPWNEYHPYYLKELESARQAQLAAGTDAARIPSTSKSPNRLLEQVAEKNEGPESFLNGVPFWDMSQADDSNRSNAEGGMPDMPEDKGERSHNGEGGMGFDAVLAAVRLATRGRVQAHEDNNESDLPKVSDGNERQVIGSDEAVFAAIRAATGRAKLDSSGSGGKEEICQVESLTGPAVKEAKDPCQTSTVSRGATAGDTNDFLETSILSCGASVGDPSNSIRISPTLLQVTCEALIASDEDHVVVSHVAKETAVSTGEQRDLKEAQLTTPEKRKAERLKKAKLFAAMIKDKNGSLSHPLQLSGPPGVSAPSLDRLNNALVASESTTLTSGVDMQGASIETEPETRGHTGDAQVHMASEADKEFVDSSVKQRKHKVKSKELEDKKRKHHHKRKKDTEEKGNEDKQSPGTQERKKDKHHDHYQDGKRKESKHGLQLEGRSKDSKRGASDGKWRDDEGFLDLGDRTEEYVEARRDGGHYTHNSYGRRKESKYGYEAKQKNIGDRHGQDSEGTQKESRRLYDSEEKRRDDGHRYDTSRKRKDRRHRHNSEERRSGDRYEYDSDEMREERSRSHRKRKKRSDRADESDDKDGRKNEHRTKDRQLGDVFSSATEYTRVERQSMPYRDLKDDRKLGLVSPAKQDGSAGTSVTQIRLGEEKSTLSSVDVPDDIRAKVRAMLAMM